MITLLTWKTAKPFEQGFYFVWYAEDENSCVVRHGLKNPYAVGTRNYRNFLCGEIEAHRRKKLDFKVDHEKIA